MMATVLTYAVIGVTVLALLFVGVLLITPGFSVGRFFREFWK